MGKLEVVIGRGLGYLAGLSCKVDQDRQLAQSKGLMHQADLLARIDSQKVQGRLTQTLREEMLKPRNPA